MAWATAGVGLATLLAACGGSEADGEEGSKLYVGYYQEDPSSNPEDPMPGTLLVRLPADQGRFEGQMPFSYIGCVGGADIGTIDGTRSAASLDGHWGGAVDGVSVGGDYAGSYDTMTDQFSGSYTNRGGKVPISGANDCHYSVAAFGSWRLFGSGSVNTPTNFVIASTGGVTPTWSWQSLGSSVFYLVRVFDLDCLEATVTSSQCMMGEGQTLLTHLAYPAEFPSAKPLVAGKSYLVAAHAVNIDDWHQVGFSTRVDKL